MKIGLVIYGSLDTISGGYMYDRKLVEYLRVQGDDVEIISLPWRNYAAHLTDNLNFRLWNQTTCPRKIQEQAPGFKKFDILIQDELNHPSLILANKRPHPYPVVSLVHHLRCSELRPKWQNAFYRMIEKKYLQTVDGFIFNSQTTKGVVTDLIGNDKPEVVAYPPTDRFGEPITEEEIKERVKKEEFRILFLGNVIHRKGLHILLGAVQSLKSKVRVDVVGGLTSEPNYVKQIQKFIHTHDLSSCVFIHGSLDNEPLIKICKQSHIIVVPSSYEGFGIVYLEGMSFGLPAIGTNAGAAGEIIEHGKTGYLIEPEDSTSLASYITELAENRNLLYKLSINAIERYKKQPKWEETARSIREFLFSFP